MQVLFDRSFDKSLDKIQSASVKRKLIVLIESIERAKTLTDIAGIKKIQGFKDYYRARVGDYRVGMEIKGATVRFIIAAHRKDIYKIFP